MTTNVSILFLATLAMLSVSAFVPDALSHQQQHQISPTTMTVKKKTAMNVMFNQDQEVLDGSRSSSGGVGGGSSIVGSSTLPGNFGFDPLNLAQTRRQLVTYRQAEIKHGRLAMLAVSAIMWSDLNVVDTIGATPLVEGRAFPEFLGACVGFPAALELYGEKIEEQHAKYIYGDSDDDDDDPSYFPGNLELDPFHLYPGETRQQYRVQMVEIMTGRLCMVAAAMRMVQNGLDWMGIDDSSSLISLLGMPSVAETTTTELM